MEEQKAIEETACIILQRDPDPVVRFRLLRDVLKEPPNTDTLMNAQREMLQSRWVLKLRDEQREDGSWGRFHSATKTRGNRSIKMSRERDKVSFKFKDYLRYDIAEVNCYRGSRLPFKLLLIFLHRHSGMKARANLLSSSEVSQLARKSKVLLITYNFV